VFFKENKRVYKPYSSKYFMGTAVVKIRIMPLSPESNLEKIKLNVQEKIENKGGKGCKFEEKPIAFGLKAVEVFFGWPEEQEVDSLEKELSEIDEINSIEILDIRRAVG
jgi:elongation factor 1-beta